MARQWTAAQRDAIDLRGRLLVVSAAAGSGKTSVLTERIVQMLCDKEQPAELSRMLIVTFTRAAAEEMRTRIATRLEAALEADPDNARLSRQVLSLGSARISTIDSFFGDEVRTNFALLGISPSFRMADQAELDEMAVQIMEETVSDLYERYTTQNSTDPAHPFERLRGNRFAAVMEHLIGDRGGKELPSVLWDFYQNFTHYPEGIGLLRDGIERMRSAAVGEFWGSDLGGLLCEQVRAEFGEPKAELETILRELDGTPARARYEGTLQSDLDLCRSILAATTYAEARAAVLAAGFGRFPKQAAGDPPAVDRYKKLRDNVLKKRVQEYAKGFFAWDEEALRGQLLAHADESEILQVLFSEFETRLDAEKQLRGVLTFSDMPFLLLRLLENEDGTPTDYAATLAARYDAVFIDEYQDVDPIQDRIFTHIGGENRFMVGDIKQSIYGFRGSDPALFAGYRRRYPLYDAATDDGTARGNCIFMSENFRCSKPIVDYTNRICSFLFSACEQSVGYRPQDDLVCGKSSPEGTAAPVRTVLFEPPPRKQDATEEDEEDGTRRDAEWIANEIVRLIREEKLENGDPIRPRDIAILARKSTGFDILTRALTARGIPVEAKADDLRFTPLTVDTLDLLRAIDNPYRDLPLSEYLLTEQGGFSLEELCDIRAASSEHCALYDALCNAAENEALPCREKCQVFTEWLEHYRALAATQPADRFLRLLYLDPKLSPHAASPELRLLYDLARKDQGSAWCGLYGFLKHIDLLFEASDKLGDGFRQAQDAVSLLTVHKSKGLEYPVVFTVLTTSDFKDDTDKLRFHRTVGATSKLCEQNGNEQESLLNSLVSAQNKSEAREEEIRILYVALTRARERLYVTGLVARGRNLNNLLQDAAQLRRGARAQILDASSPLHWIIAALSEGAEHPPVQIVPIDEVIPTDPLCEVAPLPGESLQGETEQERDAETTAAVWDPLTDPYRALRGVPTKAAASAISPDLLDRLAEADEDGTDDPAEIAAAIGVLRTEGQDFDGLLRARKQTKATDIGTAMHRFLEVCDLQGLAKNGADAEIERLRADGILPEATVALLDRRRLELLRNSNMMADILSASEILREQRFGLELPLTALTKHPERFTGMERETVFVQGSIDLLLVMPDGALHLYDYKTDRLTPEEQADPAALAQDLAERHGDQLACYALATRALFGRAPDRISIYSFPNGSAVRLNIDPDRFETDRR